MQVIETLSDGLKRAYKVVLPAKDLAERLDKELADLKDKVRINGFRPGKVPMSHLKRVYGRGVMTDVVQNAINEANRKIVEDNKLRPALSPTVDFAGGEEEVKNALEAKGDLNFTVSLETLPEFEVTSFSDVALERLVADVPESEVDETIERMADRNRPYTAKDDAAARGDRVTIDFLGKIDGEPFDGGKGEAIPLVLGSNSFIPGFEDQLVGAKAGDAREVAVTFPENYSEPRLAGRAATFDVTVKGVEAPGELKVDDELAKGFGMDSLEKLRQAVRANIEDGHGRATRDKLKRALLDALDRKYSFALPEGLVAQEFDNIWRQVEADQKRSGRSFADEKTTEEEARADYRKIAERRVRLGLVLARVGEEAKVQVSDDEVTRGLVERARAYPGQEKAVWDFYRKNPDQLAEIRAPIFEEKVVDHIVAQAQVSDRKVDKAELFKIDEPEAKV